MFFDIYFPWVGSVKPEVVIFTNVGNRDQLKSPNFATAMQIIVECCLLLNDELLLQDVEGYHNPCVCKIF